MVEQWIKSTDLLAMLIDCLLSWTCLCTQAIRGNWNRVSKHITWRNSSVVPRHFRHSWQPSPLLESIINTIFILVTPFQSAGSGWLFPFHVLKVKLVSVQVWILFVNGFLYVNDRLHISNVNHHYKASLSARYFSTVTVGLICSGIHIVIKN